MDRLDGEVVKWETKSESRQDRARRRILVPNGTPPVPTALFAEDLWMTDRTSLKAVAPGANRARLSML